MVSCEKGEGRGGWEWEGGGKGCGEKEEKGEEGGERIHADG